DGRKPLVETRERVDAQEPEKTGEPPSVVDVGEAQTQKPTVGFLSVFLNVGFGALALLDDCSDSCGNRNKQEEEHGQLNRGEEPDQLTRKLLPPYSWGGGTGSFLFGECFLPAVHAGDVFRSITRHTNPYAPGTRQMGQRSGGRWKRLP